MKLALISIESSAADPPLGLAYLSAYIKKYSKFKDIAIIDKEDIIKAVKKGNFDMVGISSTTTDFKKANQCAKLLRAFFNGPLIIGGVHITIMPHHLKESSFDIGVMGEGENTLLELWDLFNENHGKLNPDELEKINGLVFKNNANELV